MNENVCKWINDDGDGFEGIVMDENGCKWMNDDGYG